VPEVVEVACVSELENPKEGLKRSSSLMLSPAPKVSELENPKEGLKRRWYYTTLMATEGLRTRKPERGIETKSLGLVALADLKSQN